MRVIRRMTIWMLMLCLVCGTALATGDPNGMVVPGDGSNLGNGSTYDGDDDAINDTYGSTGTTDPTDEPIVYAPGEAPWDYVATDLTAQYEGKTVTVVTLGTAVSTIDMMGQKQQVATRLLTFDTKAEPGQQLAIINAPKSGYASLRKKASTKSVILEKCVSGTVVAVLETTSKFAKIHYEGAEGYVIKTALTFVTPAETEGFTATIAYNGNTKSRSTVKVRMSASSKARVVGEYACGTTVTVLSVEDDWTNVEVNGQRCSIMSDFLTGSNYVADAATDAPISADAATDAPESADAATDAPESADAATDAPESADAATDAPVSADAATGTPESADAATDAPVSADADTDLSGRGSAGAAPANAPTAEPTPAPTPEPAGVSGQSSGGSEAGN